jgi:hypothetical protein
MNLPTTGQHSKGRDSNAACHPLRPANPLSLQDDDKPYLLVLPVLTAPLLRAAAGSTGEHDAARHWFCGDLASWFS